MKQTKTDLMYFQNEVLKTYTELAASRKDRSLYMNRHLQRRQYDPLIIKRTIGLVFGPSTALYRPFLKHCTVTNKALGFYDAPCPNLLRDDKVLIFFPSDFYSGHFQPDLSSLPDGWSSACHIRTWLYKYLIYFNLCCIYIYFMTSQIGMAVGLFSI